MMYLNFEIWHESKCGWRWRLATVNGRVIAIGAEAYLNKQECLDAIDLVKGSGPAPIRQMTAPGHERESEAQED